jgi:ATP-dependent Lhr-like helicase
MPFWHGEYAARSPHLAARVGELRRELDEVRTAEQATVWPSVTVDEATVTSLVEYVAAQRAVTGGVPDDMLSSSSSSATR